MEQIDLTEMLENVRRYSHRLKNVKNASLYRKAIRIKNKIKSADSMILAKHIEASFLNEIESYYITKVPVGITSQPLAMNLNEYEASQQDLSKIAMMAEKVSDDYDNRDIQYAHVDTQTPYPSDNDASTGGNFSDCSHFVHDVLNQSGFSHIPYTTTSEIPTSPYFNEILLSEIPQQGDIILQGNHMGIFQGNYVPGQTIIGTQMGTKGPQDGKWGANGWFGNAPIRFYRPIKK